MRPLRILYTEWEASKYENYDDVLFNSDWQLGSFINMYINVILR